MARLLPSDYWTDDEINQLRTMWRDGVNVAIIVYALNKTRNAICGKRRRMKLPGRPNPVPLAGPMSQRPTVIRLTAPPRYFVYIPIVHTCQYPMTNARPWAFCDGPTERGSYCAHHAKKCYSVPTLES